MEQGISLQKTPTRRSSEALFERELLDGDAAVAVLDRPVADHASDCDSYVPAIAGFVVPGHSAVTDFLIRAIDIAGSLVMLLAALPLMLMVGLLVKVSSRGPVLFKQLRVGKNGDIFTLYKFRTMIENAEKHTGPVLASKEDERVTPVGKLLRSSRLDELPQLYNVLSGHMSLVGPRPERPYFVKRHTALQGTRLSVKPGITGLAQVRSYYDLKPEHKTRYDNLYIQNRSVMLNIYILLQTIPVIFLKRGW